VRTTQGHSLAATFDSQHPGHAVAVVRPHGLRQPAGFLVALDGLETHPAPLLLNIHKAFLVPGNLD
jgi:hypothetical protein